MEIKKINLSALSTMQTQTTSEVINEPEAQEISAIADNKNQADTSNRKKISLKNLKRNNDNSENLSSLVLGEIKQEIQTTNEEDKPTIQKVTLKKLWLSSKETAIDTTTEASKSDWAEVSSEEKNDSITDIASSNIKTSINETTEIQAEEIPKISSFEISDWDTSCKIIKEEKDEIFSNYKWSFTPEVKIEKKDTKKEEKEVVLQQEAIMQEIPEIVKNINSSNQTNLERYSESEEKFKKLKNKKIIAWIVITLWALVWGIYTSQLDFVKWSIRETKDLNPSIEQNIQNNPVEEIQINKPIQKNDTENTVITENKLEPKSDIVKENIPNQVDNIENSNNINQKLHNYLKEKYKSK